MRFPLVTFLVLLPLSLANPFNAADAAIFEIPALAQHSTGHSARNSHASHPSLLSPPAKQRAKRSRTDCDDEASSIEARGIKEEFDKAMNNVKSGAEWTKGKIVKVFT